MPPRFADWSSRPVSTVRRGHDLPRHAHASRPELSGPSVALRWPKAVTSRSCLHLRIGCRHRIKPSTVGQPAGICLDSKVAILKPLSSAVSIGTGGPFGAEGPIIMTGGAIGSLIAQLLPVSDNERKTLLVAGAAAGMTAVFGTPIAAILLAVELLLFEWTPRSFIPVAVAAIVAEVERSWLQMPSPLFAFSGGMATSFLGLGCWIAIGLLGGLLSGLLTQLVYRCE